MTRTVCKLQKWVSAWVVLCVGVAPATVPFSPAAPSYLAPHSGFYRPAPVSPRPLDLPSDSLEVSLDREERKSKSGIAAAAGADESFAHSLMGEKEIRSMRAPKQIKRYQLRGKLGEGSMGQVYLAYDENLKREVALKIVDVENVSGKARERFKREARRAAAFNNPHVIHLFDYGEGDGFLYYTMEYEEKNLETLMHERGRLPEEEAVGLALQALEGLGYIHVLGVVHRDVKPANLLVSQKGEAVVGDFSLARGKDDATLTLSRAQIGTPRYMSPEQVDGNPRLVDRRSDLFSLGVVLYYLVTGEHPFDGEQKSDIYDAILKNAPKSNEKISPALWRVIQKALAKDPRDRYANAELFAADLRRTAKGEELPAPKSRGLLAHFGWAAAPGEHARRVRLENAAAHPHLDRGDELYEQQKFADAAREYRAAVRLSPESWEAYLKLGLAIKGAAKGDFSFRDDALPLGVLDEVLPGDETPDPREAATCFRIASELNPNSYRSLLELGRLYRYSNQFELAAQFAERAAGIFPQSYAAHALLRRCYEELEEREKADEATKKMRLLEGEKTVTVEGEQPAVIHSLDGVEEEGAEAGSLFDALPQAIGEYKIVRRLGVGGMGVVYEARDLRTGRPVAIKLFPRYTDRAARDRFQREVASLTRFHDPRVVKVYEQGEHDGRLFYAMEFVAGRTLAEEISDRGLLDPAEAARILADLARAVQVIHDGKVVHGDIKPANVIRDPQTRQHKLADFGLARLLDEETAAAPTAGTPVYMSPEQARGAAATEASDVYSLGATLYELAAGRRAFQGSSVHGVLEKVSRGDFARPRAARPDLPADLEAIILRAMAHDPRERYGSPRELLEDLERFLKGEKVLARPLGKWERLKRWAGKKIKRATPEEREMNRLAATPFYEAAEELYALSCAPRNPGFEGVNERFLEEAHAGYARAVELDPDFAEAHLKLGLIARRRGRLDEALDHFNRSLELEPNSPRALIARGYIKLRKGVISGENGEKAVKDFQDAFKIRDHSVDVQYGMFLCEFIMEGRFDLMSVKRVLELDSSHLPALILWVLNDQVLISKEVKDFRSSWPSPLSERIPKINVLLDSWDPNSPAFLDFCLRMIDTFDASAHKRIFRGLSADLVEATLWVRNLRSASMEFCRMSRRYFERGDLENARKACALALKFDSEHTDAKKLMAEIEFALGKRHADAKEWEEAAAHFNRARTEAVTSDPALHAEILIEEGNLFWEWDFEKYGADAYRVWLEAARELKKVNRSLDLSLQLKLWIFHWYVLVAEGKDSPEMGNTELRKAKQERILANDPEMEREALRQAILLFAKLKGKAAVARLVRLFDAGQDFVRETAIAELVKLGEAVVPNLIEHVGLWNSERTRIASRQSLIQIGEPAVAPLLEAVRNPLKTDDAIETLAAIGGDKAEEGLLKILEEAMEKWRRDPNEEETLSNPQSDIIHALGLMKSERAIPILIRRLQERPLRRLERVTVVDLRDGREARFRSKNNEVSIREFCEEALIQIGVPAVPLLLEKIQGDNPSFFRSAARILGRLKAQEGLEKLVWLLNQPRLQVKEEALRALAAILGRENLSEAEARRLVDEIHERHASESARLRAAAVAETAAEGEQILEQLQASPALVAAVGVPPAPGPEAVAPPVVTEEPKPRRPSLDEVIARDAAAGENPVEEKPAKEPKKKELEGGGAVLAVGKGCYDEQSNRRVNAVIRKAIRTEAVSFLNFPKAQEDPLGEFINRATTELVMSDALKLPEATMILSTSFVLLKPGGLASAEIPTLLFVEDENRFQVAHAGAGGMTETGEKRYLRQVYLSYGLLYRLYRNGDFKTAGLLLKHEAEHAAERQSRKQYGQVQLPEQESQEVRNLIRALRPYIEDDLRNGKSVENQLSDSRRSGKGKPFIPAVSPLVERAL